MDLNYFIHNTFPALYKLTVNYFYFVYTSGWKCVVNNLSIYLSIFANVMQRMFCIMDYSFSPLNNMWIYKFHIQKVDEHTIFFSFSDLVYLASVLRHPQTEITTAI